MKTKLIDEPLSHALLEVQAPILPPQERAQALRKRVLGRLHGSNPERPMEHLTVREAEGIWVPLLAGIRLKVLREDADTRSFLLRMEPGARLPGHDHIHEEECMVLEGDVWLGDIHARAGDYHLARLGVPHGELRSDDGCLLFLRGQKEYRDIRPA